MRNLTKRIKDFYVKGQRRRMLGEDFILEKVEKVDIYENKYRFDLTYRYPYSQPTVFEVLELEIDQDFFTVDLRRKGSTVIVEFTHDELKFFDLNGYKLHFSYTNVMHTKIEDWIYDEE